MIWNQNIICRYDFPLESASHQFAEAIGFQRREEFQGALSEYLILGLAREFLHEWIEQSVAQICVVDDDALCDTSNDFCGEAVDISRNLRVQHIPRTIDWRPHPDLAVRAQLGRGKLA